MIRPKNFGYNAQTALSNSFQNDIQVDNLSDKALREFDEMVMILESNEIRVKVFEDLGDQLFDSVFPNNWISHSPKGHVVVYPMANLNRQAEVRTDIINFVEQLIPESNRIDMRLKADQGKFLEGTGSIIFDHENKVAFAAESSRTDIRLFNQLCEMMDYKQVSFESFDLKSFPIYHTNVMLSISEKFSIVCLDSITNLIERVMVKRELEKLNKEIIELTFEQMNSFAANSFEVLNQNGESCLLISRRGVESLSNDQLDQIKKYSKIIPLSVPNIEDVGGGSVRCMVAGLFS